MRRSTHRLLLVLFFGFVGCASSPRAALHAFAAELRRVEAADPETFPQGGQGLRPSDLRGLPRSAIIHALGDPRSCSSREIGDNERWCGAYHFYRLPPNSGGGGPELELYFDGRDVCVRGKWILTM